MEKPSTLTCMNMGENVRINARGEASDDFMGMFQNFSC